MKAKLGLSERTYRCEHCGLAIDRDANAATNLASRAEAFSNTGTASGAGTGRGTTPANAQGEDRFMPSGRWSSLNCEDGNSSAEPDKTVTATRQRVAPEPIFVGSDR